MKSVLNSIVYASVQVGALILMMLCKRLCKVPSIPPHFVCVNSMSVHLPRVCLQLKADVRVCFMSVLGQMSQPETLCCAGCTVQPLTVVLLWDQCASRVSGASSGMKLACNSMS